MADMFQPKFDAAGLLTAVVTHAETGELLMVAHMNAEAIELTRRSGRAHFWSRSRQALWLKGESSGHFLDVRDILVDCDQDCLWVKALPAGPACHTGAPSCFFRRLTPEGLAPA
jgi:phosphoribosyl-AMP cyclohydrolase